MFSKTALVAACLSALACSRQISNPPLQRIAILRFENLTGDTSLDWMGRAFSEMIAGELEGVPEVYALPSTRLHGFDQAFGPRPKTAPGISAERDLAIASGATRLGYGEYALRQGHLEAQLTVEDLQTGKMTEVLSASASGDSVIDAATALAHQISNRAGPFGSRSPAAVKAYILALETADPTAGAQQLEQAIAADPNFGSPYTMLAEYKARRQDTPGAGALLRQALAHNMPELQRAKIEFEAATLEGDAAARQKALASWARLDPNEPLVWRSIAEAAMSRHDYTQAVQAYQKALAVEPADITVLNGLGYAAGYAGDLVTAGNALRRYQELRPGDVNPIDSLGDVNLLLGRLGEAEKLYLSAAKQNPNFLGGGDFFKAATAHLMTGDVTGADRLEDQYIQTRSAAHDPIVELQKAEWDWISGRRKEGYDRLAAFAKGAEAGPLREAASRAYSELAIWSVAMGDRSTGAGMAQKAATLAGPGSAAVAAIARFVAQPSAAAAQWSTRAGAAFPLPAQKSIKDAALIYALLSDKQFQAAASVLEPIYARTSPTADDISPILLAWAYLETGKPREAASLLRFNPIPSASGIKQFSVFYFPRLFALRGRVAQAAGNSDQARSDLRVFQQLSGTQRLVWGEEEKIR